MHPSSGGRRPHFEGMFSKLRTQLLSDACCCPNAATTAAAVMPACLGRCCRASLASQLAVDMDEVLFRLPLAATACRCPTGAAAANIPRACGADPVDIDKPGCCTEAVTPPLPHASPDCACMLLVASSQESRFPAIEPAGVSDRIFRNCCCCSCVSASILASKLVQPWILSLLVLSGWGAEACWGGDVWTGVVFSCPGGGSVGSGAVTGVAVARTAASWASAARLSSCCISRRLLSCATAMATTRRCWSRNCRKGLQRRCFFFLLNIPQSDLTRRVYVFRCVFKVLLCKNGRNFAVPAFKCSKVCGHTTRLRNCASHTAHTCLIPTLV